MGFRHLFSIYYPAKKNQKLLYDLWHWTYLDPRGWPTILVRFVLERLIDMARNARMESLKKAVNSVWMWISQTPEPSEVNNVCNCHCTFELATVQPRSATLVRVSSKLERRRYEFTNHRTWHPAYSVCSPDEGTSGFDGILGASAWLCRRFLLARNSVVSPPLQDDSHSTPSARTGVTEICTRCKIRISPWWVACIRSLPRDLEFCQFERRIGKDSAYTETVLTSTSSELQFLRCRRIGILLIQGASCEDHLVKLWKRFGSLSHLYLFMIFILCLFDVSNRFHSTLISTHSGTFDVHWTWISKWILERYIDK